MILLDVVAERAGAVAEVTARYKDLVWLKNATARASLAVAPGEAPVAALERSVLKNLVAASVAAAERAAGTALASGDVPGALAALGEARALVDGLRARVPGWQADADLASDGHLLAQFTQLLAGGAADALRDPLAESLQYTSHLKLTPEMDQP